MTIKNIAFYTAYDKRFQGNQFINDFDDSNEYVAVSKQLKKVGFEVHSLDIFNKKKISPDVCFFLDIPPHSVSKLIGGNTYSIVLLREPDNTCQENYKKNRHNEFDLILTWKTSLIDNVKYLPYPSTRLASFEQLQVKDCLNRKLCVLINSNLFSKLDGELYSLRRMIINWFDKFNPKDFELWGYGWDKFSYLVKGRTIFQMKKPKKLIPWSYQGVTKNKFETLSQFKFSICFENTNKVNDYISEKIFDAFIAQNVPIYFGAPNISEIIPKECFIDYRDFNSFEDLYLHLKNMSDDEYLKYIAAINQYMKSSKVQKFSLKNWVDIVSGAIHRLSI